MVSQNLRHELDKVAFCDEVRSLFVASADIRLALASAASSPNLVAVDKPDVRLFCETFVLRGGLRNPGGILQSPGGLGWTHGS